MGNVSGILNVVLLGKPGAGKSSSGNTILGRRAFISNKSSSTVTLGVAVESGVVEGFPVTVYDTPGLSDIDMSEEEIQQMVNEKVLQKCSSGLCVFLLVIKADRFTEEERKTVEKIEKMLGKNNQNNTWILFTGGDKLEEENKTIQEFINETKALKTLVQKYGHRYHLFNNRKEETSEQVKILFTKIKTYIDTMGTHYCHPLKVNMCPQLQAPLPLCFHANTKGFQIWMDKTQRSAWRIDSFCDAITFTSRPVMVYEQVQLKITKTEGRCSGALRVGFSIVDPSGLSSAWLPQIAFPDLESRKGFWAETLPEEHCNEGTILSFWLDNKRQVFYSVNAGSPIFLFSGVPAGEKAWAIIDLYGQTCGVQLFAKPSRRIVLLGERCVGKRAARETILGQKESTRRRSRQVTHGCSEAQATVSDRSVSVVDTPGVFDTYRNPEQLMLEIARSVCLFSPGLHAFLIVFPVYMRFTEQELKIPRMMENIFGEEVLKYSIILFTHGDLLDGESVEKLIEENSGLRSVVQQCGGRYHVFNNRDVNNREQVEDLLQKIDSMIQQNGGAHYSNEMLEDAQRFRQEEEKERQREVARRQNLEAFVSELEPTEFEVREEMEQLELIACAREEDETERLISMRLFERLRKKEEIPTRRLIERVREEAELMLRIIEQLREKEDKRDPYTDRFDFFSVKSVLDSLRPTLTTRVKIGRMMEKEEKMERQTSRERKLRIMEEVRKEEEEEIEKLTLIESRSRMMEEEEDMEGLRSKLRTRCSRMRVIERVKEEVELTLGLIRQLRDNATMRQLTAQLREEGELAQKMIEQLRMREKEESAIDELKLASRERRQKLREQLREEMGGWGLRGMISAWMRPIRKRTERLRLIEQIREEREMERKRLIDQIREEEEMERWRSIPTIFQANEFGMSLWGPIIHIFSKSSIEMRLRLIEQVRQKVELTLGLIRELRDMEEEERMTCVCS